jgi:GntR family transcriptional regulator/MocR family aminotransferase
LTISEVAAARAAAERDIVVSPIARFSLETTALNGLVLGFGGIKPAEIRSGVERLGQALAGLQTTRRAAGGRRQSPT